MSTILLTGASGFLGSQLLAELSRRHTLVTIGRKSLPTAPSQVHYLGNFSEFEDLRQLDRHSFDVVLHLAAVTGGCLEREGLLVNVEGTRCLMRYLIDRGCRKFVNASSIAVVGIQSTSFRPLHLPIADEHPCMDRDGYGFSKYLMEEVTRYLNLQTPDTDIINLRLAAIYSEESPPERVAPGPISAWAVGRITQLSRSHAVDALTRAVEAPLRPGVRILNAVSRKSWVTTSTADVLRSWWGSDVDLSALEQGGDPQASVFRSDAIARELGFVAED